MVCRSYVKLFALADRLNILISKSGYFLLCETVFSVENHNKQQPGMFLSAAHEYKSVVSPGHRVRQILRRTGRPEDLKH